MKVRSRNGLKCQLHLLFTSARIPKVKDFPTGRNNHLASGDLRLEFVQFYINIESIYATANDTLGDWLKNLVPDFQPMRSKTKTNRALCA